MADLKRSLVPHFATGHRPISSAVYGTVSVVALIVVAAHEDNSAGRVLTFAAVSMLVIWAVHVYASTLEHTGPKNLPWRAALRVAVHDELGVVEGASAPLLILLLGAVGLVEDGRAITWAVWCGAALLTLMPFVWLRRVGTPLWDCVLASAVAGILGALLIVFKVLVH